MKPKILLAEHDSADQYVINAMLEHLGCEVDAVNNGFLAVDAVRHHRYDLVLASRDLPMLDALETTQLMRQIPEGARVRVIAMLNEARMEDVFRCAEAGTNDYITKPLALSKFKDLLHKWLPNIPEFETATLAQ